MHAYAVFHACWFCVFHGLSVPWLLHISCSRQATSRLIVCAIKVTDLLISNEVGSRFILCFNSKCSVNLSTAQAALFAITSAAEVLSRCIEGGEGGDGPADEAAAASVAQLLLQLLLHLSAASTSLAHSSRERVHLLELLLMQTMAPTLMHHVAGTNVAQAQVCPASPHSTPPYRLHHAV